MGLSAFVRAFLWTGGALFGLAENLGIFPRRFKSAAPFLQKLYVMNLERDPEILAA
jgi:hypothetical protein